MAYVLQGVVGRLGYYGAGGLGDSSKKDALEIAKLRAMVQQGVPGAEQALAEATKLLPAQQAYDAQANTMRAAAEPQLPKTNPARAIALAALESTIKRTLGLRPQGHPPAFFAAQGGGGGAPGGSTSSGGGGFMDFLKGDKDVDIGGHQVSSTTLVVGALVIGGVLYYLSQ